MIELLTALLLAIALEGIFYALFPMGMKRMMATVLTLPAWQLRLSGLAAAGVAVLLLWLLRG